MERRLIVVNYDVVRPENRLVDGFASGLRIGWGSEALGEKNMEENGPLAARVFLERCFHLKRPKDFLPISILDGSIQLLASYQTWNEEFGASLMKPFGPIFIGSEVIHLHPSQSNSREYRLFRDRPIDGSCDLSKSAFCVALGKGWEEKLRQWLRYENVPLKVIREIKTRIRCFDESRAESFCAFVTFEGEVIAVTPSFEVADRVSRKELDRFDLGRAVRYFPRMVKCTNPGCGGTKEQPVEMPGFYRDQWNGAHLVCSRGHFVDDDKEQEATMNENGSKEEQENSSFFEEVMETVNNPKRDDVLLRDFLQVGMRHEVAKEWLDHADDELKIICEPITLLHYFLEGRTSFDEKNMPLTMDTLYRLGFRKDFAREYADHVNDPSYGMNPYSTYYWACRIIAERLRPERSSAAPFPFDENGPTDKWISHTYKHGSGINGALEHECHFYWQGKGGEWRPDQSRGPLSELQNYYDLVGNRLLLFHGCDWINAEKATRHGIRWSTETQHNFVDFGPALYVSLRFHHAENWARKIAEQSPAVIEYAIDEAELQKFLPFYEFDGPTEEWADTILWHRMSEPNIDIPDEIKDSQWLKGPCGTPTRGEMVQCKSPGHEEAIWQIAFKSDKIQRFMNQHIVAVVYLRGKPPTGKDSKQEKMEIDYSFP